MAAEVRLPSGARFLGEPAVLGESPIWDPRLDALFWVDINSCLVHRWDAASDRVETRAMAGRPGCIALTDRPGVLVVAMEHTILLLDWPTGESTIQIELPIAEESTRLNDGRVDRAGNLWVGSMHAPASDGLSVGSLYRVLPDWTSREMITGVGVANGLAFPADGGSMYFADTFPREVWRYLIDNDGIGPAEPFIDFEALGLPGKPDGACVDSEGGYWIACVHGGAVARITPDGTLDRVVETPFRRPTCVAFGGPDLSTLFVTSIGGGGYYPQFDDEPDAGRVLAFDVGFTGFAEAIFVPS